jgi:hypothetical protein
MIADIIAQDADGREVLIVEVTTLRWSPEVVSQTLERIAEAFPSVPFGMIVDPDWIRVIAFDGAGRPEERLRLNTGDILRHYEPQFGTFRVFADYLRTLTEGWLRDLAYRWKSQNPPGSQEMASVGLLPLLGGGTTRSEVPLGVDSLR